jgi:hypothetical protein
VSNEKGTPDALFFFQLLLPICDPKQSGRMNDNRSVFFHEITKFSNLYKHQNEIGNGYGHNIPEVSAAEYVRFDGCIFRDGVRGGGDGAIYRHWLQNTSASDIFVQKALTLDRWHQLKRIYKLNNNDTSPKRGELGYDPCYKYDLIFKTIIKNVIFLTKRGKLDLTGNETSWAHMGFGEAQSGNLTRIQNKPGVSKGGQLAIVSATNRIRPYWYQHRHKLNDTYGPGFKAQGQAEVRSCIDVLKLHVQGKYVESHGY